MLLTLPCVSQMQIASLDLETMMSLFPLKVLEEIDKHKKRQDSVGFNARKIIKHFDNFRARGSLPKGIRIEKGQGIIKVCDKTGGSLPASLDSRVADHVILASAMSVQQAWEKRKTVVVSRDINMRVIANSIGLDSEDYETEKVVEDADKLYSGFEELVVDDEMIDQFYAGEPITISEELCESQKAKLYPNQFVMLISSANPKRLHWQDTPITLCHLSHTKKVGRQFVLGSCAKKQRARDLLMTCYLTTTFLLFLLLERQDLERL